MVPRRSAGVVVALSVGPEVLSWSTRLKAGTATKLTLNTLTTGGAFARFGKVYGNRMVDLRPLRQASRADARTGARDRRRLGEGGGASARCGPGQREAGHRDGAAPAPGAGGAPAPRGGERIAETRAGRRLRAPRRLVQEWLPEPSRAALGSIRPRDLAVTASPRNCQWCATTRRRSPSAPPRQG